MLGANDRARAACVKHFYRVDPAGPGSHRLVLDAARSPVARCADLGVGCARGLTQAGVSKVEVTLDEQSSAPNFWEQWTWPACPACRIRSPFGWRSPRGAGRSARSPTSWRTRAAS